MSKSKTSSPQSVPPKAGGSPSATTAHVATNLFPVTMDPNPRYLYHVTFAPNLDNQRVQERLLSTILAERHLSPFIFSGSHVHLPARVETITAQVSHQNVTYCITLAFLREETFIDNTRLQNETLGGAFQQLGLQQIGRHYFPPTTKTSSPGAFPLHAVQIPAAQLAIPQGLSAVIHPGTLPAGIVSDSNTEGNNVTHFAELDIVSKLLHTKSILAIIHQFQNENWSREKISAYFRDRIIRTDYNGRTYRVDGVDFSGSPATDFMLNRGPLAGTSISVGTYARQHYGIPAPDPSQPLLYQDAQGTKNGSTRLYFLPEFCTLTGLDDVERADFNLMREVTKAMQVDPASRMEKLLAITHNPRFQEVIAAHGLTLGEDMLALDCEKLGAHQVLVGSQVLAYPADSGNWRSALNRAPIDEPRSISRWVILFPAGKMSRAEAESFGQDLVHLGLDIGMRISSPSVVAVPHLDDLPRLSQVQQVCRNADFVMSIVPSRGKKTYGIVKRFFLADASCGGAGIPHQNVVLKTVRSPKNRNAIFQNLLRQVNTKVPNLPAGLGGALWHVSPDFLPPDTMVVGIDVTHSPDPSCPSLAGFVASLDNGRHYYAQPLPFQVHGQELVHTLKDAVIAALRAYQEHLGGLPKRILVYRDGVGRSQLDQLLRVEVASIEAAFGAFSDYHPQLAVIVVHKKTTRRLFEQDASGAFHNPRPGVVCPGIATEVPHDNFYLVSQSTPVGSVSPTHYIVVKNGTDLTLPDVQRITFQLTHAYFNWPGTIKVAAPVEYAHRVALLCGLSRIKKMKEELKRTQFYL